MYLKIRSRNFSANQLRKQITTEIPAVYRLGSFTPNDQIFKEKYLNNKIIEINTVESCQNSNDKIKMKEYFVKFEVPTAKYTTFEKENGQFKTINDIENLLKYPLIIKHKNSSKGNGIYFIKDDNDLKNFYADHEINNNYVIEEYKTYSKEYRLHIDKFGCFLAHRKMLKNDVEVRWHRHHNNTVWFVEGNPKFDKPDNWDEIVKAAQLAIKSIGLDIGCVDVKVQTHKENPKFIILETNSAPALGEETANLYKEELKKILKDKINEIQ